MHPGHFLHGGVRTAFRGHQPVGHEVPVVGSITELASVGESLSARRALPQTVVLPFPDESTLKNAMLVDQTPVVGQSAIGVTHRVAVLAHHEWTGAEILRGVQLDGRGW